MFLLDWLFPIKCYGCGRTGSYLCSACFRKVKKIKQPADWFLSQQRESSELKRIISLYPFKSFLVKMLKDYKYNQVRHLKQTLVDLVVFRLSKLPITDVWKEEDFSFCPIPLHPLKKMHRGFNQSAEILKDICLQVGFNYQPELIKRKKWTKSQTNLSSRERRENLGQAFVVDKKTPLPKRVVLFDDVSTTGSTLISASEVLAKKGCIEINGLTLFKTL